MALMRILVDGYSLLHSCPDLAPGKARHSAAAREELIHLLTQYRDAIGTSITVFFDGRGAPPGTPGAVSSPEMEVLYSKSDQTADDMIERTAHRMSAYGEVLVVTDDGLERDTVLAVGGMTSSCASFLATMQATLGEMATDLTRHNQNELRKFKRPRP